MSCVVSLTTIILKFKIRWGGKYYHPAFDETRFILTLNTSWTHSAEISLPGYADCVEKHVHQNNKYVVNKKIEHVDDISFRELFGRIRVGFFYKKKICRQHICYFGGRVFQHSRHTLGTNCAPFLVDMFLYSYEADFIQGFLKKNI
jgi:hypothetical protein